jgi:NADPH2:quinone reductase
VKAIVCEEAGSIEKVRYRDFPEPTPGPGEVIVETRAMGVNFPDLLQVQGLYQLKPPCPFVVGMEYSGVVRAVGAGCDTVKPGDRVAGMTQGAFANLIRTRETTCFRLPDGMSFEDGAALTLAAGTAMYALTRRAGLRAGETLVVFGAAGGTGLAAVQIGKALGARVIAVCSSEEKMDIARANGASETINYLTEDLAARLNELTGGTGVDVLYDPVGGSAFEIAARRMAWNGRILVVGFASGMIPKLAANLPLIKGYSLIGVHWDAALTREPELVRAVIGELFKLHERGAVVPVIDEVMKLENGIDAIRKMSDRKVKGKLLLRA